MKKVAATAKISTKLYGEDFGEHCKSAKVVNNVAKEIKAQTNLNYQRPRPKARMKVREKKPTYPRTYNKPATNFKYNKKYQNKVEEKGAKKQHHRFK